MKHDIVIQGGRLVTEDGVLEADLGIQGEKIAEIGPGLSGEQMLPAEGLLVVPGGVDPHVHLEMPTPVTVTSDTWASGSIAAACGGTTTVIDFVEPGYPGQPLLEAYQENLAKARRGSAVDFSFHMTVCEAAPATLEQIPGVVAAGMPSFKVYTTYAGFQLGDAELLAVLEAARQAQGLVIVHAESDAIIQHAVRARQAQGRLAVRDFAGSRPAIAEKEAVERVLALAEYAGAPVYIVHVSSQGGAAAIARARQAGQAAWGETCPQYLLLDDTRLATDDFSGAKFVCCPPLRSPADQQALWNALQVGSLKTVGTDHCAFNYHGQKDLGKRSFLEIPSGLPGIELRLPLLYTYGVKTGRLSLEQWVELCCTAPARLFGLYPRKGTLAPGADADIVIFDPKAGGIVRKAALHENVDYSPYEGFELAGKVATTLLRGRILVQAGEWTGGPPEGDYVPGSPFQATGSI